MLGLTSPEGVRGARLAAEPSYGSIDFAARCGISPLFEPPQTALIELKRLLARQRRRPHATARRKDLSEACGEYICAQSDRTPWRPPFVSSSSPPYRTATLAQDEDEDKGEDEEGESGEEHVDEPSDVDANPSRSRYASCGQKLVVGS